MWGCGACVLVLECRQKRRQGQSEERRGEENRFGELRALRFDRQTQTQTQSQNGDRVTAKALHARWPETLTITGSRAHCAEGTSQIKFCHLPAFSANSNVLISAGLNGCLVVWDERISQPAITLEDDRAAKGFLCFDVLPQHNMIATGTALKGEDAAVLYWDPRSPAAPTHAHTSVHSEDITSLQFKPSSASSPVLLSTSSDGLLSLSNPLESDEDEAGLLTHNVGCSVARAVWTSDGRYLCATTDMETAAIWTDELDLVYDFADIRSQAVGDFQIDYVVDVLPIGQEICFALGSNEGDVLLASVSPASPQTWTVQTVLRGTHQEIVRCVHVDASNSSIMTGGEDSILAKWQANLGAVASQDVEMEDESAATGSRRKRTLDENENRDSKRKRR
ncbi:WD40 repeat-like protein [Auriculariales sp. MPI-PUGE-AT-0066]|nr:WD40 repeat-like protein [Auriculariales sp. MPI-PUGE-AT-0066]